MRHIIDLSDLTDKEFNDLYKLTTNIIDRPEGYVDACRGKVLGSLFYEPSTRTNLSFSTAMMRLGGSVVGFSDPRSSSTTKGETLKDTINMVSCYADMIVMRNPREGAAKAASLYSSVPVINAGDGGHSRGRKVRGESRRLCTACGQYPAGDASCAYSRAEQGLCVRAQRTRQRAVLRHGRGVCEVPPRTRF